MSAATIFALTICTIDLLSLLIIRSIHLIVFPAWWCRNSTESSSVVDWEGNAKIREHLWTARMRQLGSESTDGGTSCKEIPNLTQREQGLLRPAQTVPTASQQHPVGDLVLLYHTKKSYAHSQA